MNVRLMGSRKNSRVIMIITIILLGLAVIIMPAFGLYKISILNEQHRNELDKMQVQLDEWKQKVDQVEQNKRTVYVPKNEISMFTVITKEMLNQVEIYSSIPQEHYISEADYGRMTTVALSKELPVMKHLLVDERIDSDIRENEFNMFFLPSNLKKDDLIDIRIAFPNGEDYIVLSKKKIQKLSSQKNTIWIWLNEREIHRIGSAIIDAYLHAGTRLYVLKYVQPEAQDEVITSYIVNENVMEVMKSSPNILKLAKEELALEVRKLLEERISILSQESISAIESKLGEDLAKRQLQETEPEPEPNTDTDTDTEPDTDNDKEVSQSSQISGDDGDIEKVTEEGSKTDDGFN